MTYGGAVKRKKREKRFVVRMSVSEHKALHRLADERDISASQLIRRAIKKEAVTGESR